MQANPEIPYTPAQRPKTPGLLKNTAGNSEKSGVTMPSGEFVVLEAAELLKHFKAESDTHPAAAADIQSPSREVLRTKRKRDYSQGRQEWPMAKLQVRLV